MTIEVETTKELFDLAAKNNVFVSADLFRYLFEQIG